MSWQGSTRRARLPQGWPTIARRILERDRHSCYLCGGHATEVDHVQPGDNHTDTNLAAICHHCHKTKSAREGGQAGARTQRQPERHPGSL